MRTIVKSTFGSTFVNVITAFNNILTLVLEGKSGCKMLFLLVAFICYSAVIIYVNIMLPVISAKIPTTFSQTLSDLPLCSATCSSKKKNMKLLLPALVMSRIWVRQRACRPPPWHPGCHPALLNHFAIFSPAKNLPRLNSSSYLMVRPHVAFQIQACNVAKLGMQDAIVKMLLSCDFETPCASRFVFLFSAIRVNFKWHNI